MNKNKEEKNQKSLETLQVTVSKTLVRFKFITGIIFIFSILGLILAIVTRSASYDYSWWILLFLSISLILISSYLFLGFYAISTITDYKILRNKLNIFFSILIPASAAGMIVGVILPLLALFMFISCIALTIHAIKFNLAYSHARKNNLI
jgi:hypothetical protein